MAAPEAGLTPVALRGLSMLEADPMLSGRRRSDHAPFWEANYPALMITDTASFRNSHYHRADGPDTVETLDHAFAAAVIAATVNSAQVMLEGG